MHRWTSLSLGTLQHRCNWWFWLSLSAWSRLQLLGLICRRLQCYFHHWRQAALGARFHVRQQLQLGVWFAGKIDCQSGSNLIHMPLHGLTTSDGDGVRHWTWWAHNNNSWDPLWTVGVVSDEHIVPWCESSQSFLCVMILFLFKLFLLHSCFHIRYEQVKSWSKSLWHHQFCRWQACCCMLCDFGNWTEIWTVWFAEFPLLPSSSPPWKSAPPSLPDRWRTDGKVLIWHDQCHFVS